jgi:cytosine/adenosine deaminase-related metal-dependent hydrolase
MRSERRAPDAEPDRHRARREDRQDRAGWEGGGAAEGHAGRWRGKLLMPGIAEMHGHLPDAKAPEEILEGLSVIGWLDL